MIQLWLFRLGAVSTVAYFPVRETLIHFAEGHEGLNGCGCAEWLVVPMLIVACGAAGAVAAFTAVAAVCCGTAWLWDQIVAIDRSMR